MKPKLTNGRLSKNIAFSTEGNAPPARPQTDTVTPIVIFDRSIQRAENIIRLYSDSKSKKTGPSDPVDTYRAAIVLAVAALDAYVRTFVAERVSCKIMDPRQMVSSKLREHVKQLLNHDNLFDAARHGDLGSRIEKALRESFEGRSFQGVKNIEDAMGLVGYEDIFHTIACSASVNEDHLKRDLGTFTKRRHIIAHCGDYNINQTPATENAIDRGFVEKCIKTVKLIASEISKLS
jgi:hypothetical protein